MEAFHTFRVRPGRKGKLLTDVELWTAVLSVLKWQEKNGTIKLVTDNRGAAYIEQCGLLELWDEVEVSLDEMDKFGWDEVVFWAGAKLYALSQQKMPCVMIDLDFIVWHNIDFNIYGHDVAVIHREAINNDIYPSDKYFRFKGDWQLPTGLDWQVPACNTALAYFGSRDLVKRYCDFAFEFMAMADTSNAGLPYMVFIEQRWLAMCATVCKRKIYELASLDELWQASNQYFTHIWGHKDIFRNKPEMGNDFCRKCAQRVALDYPRQAAWLRTLPWTEKYWQ